MLLTSGVLVLCAVTHGMVAVGVVCALTHAVMQGGSGGVCLLYPMGGVCALTKRDSDVSVL